LRTLSRVPLRIPLRTPPPIRVRLAPHARPAAAVPPAVPVVPNCAAPPAGRLRAAPHAMAAARLVGAAARLDGAQRAAVAAAWADLLDGGAEAWLAAERAAADAVATVGRTAEHDVLLEQLGAAFRRPLGFAGAAGAADRVNETDASAEYVAAVALAAVLVRDGLAAEHFALLYRPLAPHIRLDGLERE
jgi:hypothetical protein